MHSFGELLLRDAQCGSAHDDQSCQGLEWGEALVLGADLGIVERCTDVLGYGRADWTLIAGMFGSAWHRWRPESDVSIFVKPDHGASCPTARGGRRGLLFIRVWKSCHRTFAVSTSEVGSLAVVLRKAWSRTISLSDRR